MEWPRLEIRGSVLARVTVLAVALALAAGCETVSVTSEPYVDTHGLAGVEPPRSLAVLPVMDDSRHPELVTPLREALFGALAALPFEDRELELVDQRLATIANRLGVLPEELPESAQAHPMLADICVFTRVRKVSRFFLIFYSHHRLGLDFAMVDTRTRRIFYRGKFVIHNRQLVPTIEPVGAIGSAFSSLWHLRSDKLRETLAEGARKIVADIPPVPSPAAAGKNLRIEKVDVVLPRPVLKAGDALGVRLIGTPGAQAEFSIGNFAREQALREVSPGRYEGLLTIRKGVNTPYAVVEVTLSHGEERVEDTVTGRPFAIDTIAPPPARVSEGWAAPGGGVQLDLATVARKGEAATETPAEFEIRRRAAGRGAFESVGVTRARTFHDGAADAGQPWDYTIVTRDDAGNESAPGPVTRLDLRKRS